MAGFEVALTGRFWVAPDSLPETIDLDFATFTQAFNRPASQAAKANTSQKGD